MDDTLEKVCPRCGAKMFDDMDMCFECMYAFESDETWHDAEVPQGVYAEEGPMPRTWTLRMTSDVADATLAVPSEGIVIGRGESCDVVLHARLVSRRHVSVRPEQDCLVAHDLGAHNLAAVNGRRIDGRERMGPGDVLDVCGVSFTVL